MNKHSTKTLFFIALLICGCMPQAGLIGLAKAYSNAVGPEKIEEGVVYFRKPVFPLKINESDIPINNPLQIRCYLKAGAKYHIYFYGDWIDYSHSVNKTDYDVFVYDPFGKLVSMHTESAGLPEHLGTTVSDPFFVPEYTGNYTFLIKNDGKDENWGAKSGTFVVIEHLECNKWYEVHMQGEILNKPVVDTIWAFEFTTTSGRVEVPVIVPESLDMYEVQLYLMANPTAGVGTWLNGIPLPVESSLYGVETTVNSIVYGGLTLKNEGFRVPNASDSCEFYGQDMLINYSSGLTGNTNLLLYYLGLIAEEGEGTVRFMFKTDFTAPALEVDPIDKAVSNREVTVTAHTFDSGSGLQTVSLNYTANDWKDWNTVEMSSSSKNVFTAIIPGQPEGTTVKFKVTAIDMAGNSAARESSYLVKNATSLSISLSSTVLTGSDSIRVHGWISKGLTNVTLNFVTQNTHILKTVLADVDGLFVYDFVPNMAGTWSVSASWSGDQKWWDVYSELLSFIVRKVSTSITCNVNRISAILGETIDVSGYVAPAERNLKVTVSLTQPDGTVVTRTAYTSSDGSYEVSGFQPNVKGQWQISASLVGDAFHEGSRSSLVSLNVSDQWYNEYRLYLIAAGGVAGIVAMGVFFFTRSKEEIEED